MTSKRKRSAAKSQLRLPAYPTEALALVNAMDRSHDPLAVAVAALRHHALTRRPVPDYHAALAAERTADVVLAALWRRGWLAAPRG